MGFFATGASEAFTAKLNAHILSGRISTSYMFAGTADRFPLDITKGFAKALNCQIQDGDFCDVCHSCQTINSEANPDFAVYTPETTRFGIGLVRKIQEDSIQSNYNARYRVNILANAETMTTEAQNSLLKMLEEGRKTCVNILVVSTLETMLSTILSRSIVLKIPPPSQSKVVSLLEEAGYSEPDANTEAESGTGQSRVLLWISKNSQTAERIASLLSKSGQADPISVIDALSQEDQLENIVRFITELVHRAKLLRSGVNTPVAGFGTSIHAISSISQSRFGQIEKIVKEVERLWKTQIRKQQLLQTKLLSTLT
jgi:DNA polymerase-3 subunit delta'